MKAKRLVALLTAIVLIGGLVAIPASASVYAIANCPACYTLYGDGSKYAYNEYRSWHATNPQQVTGCSKMTGYHYHYDRYRYYTTYCDQHGCIRDGEEWQHNVCFGG